MEVASQSCRRAFSDYCSGGTKMHRRRLFRCLRYTVRGRRARQVVLSVVQKRLWRRPRLVLLPPKLLDSYFSLSYLHYGTMEA